MKTVLFALCSPSNLFNTAQWKWYKLEFWEIEEVQSLNFKLCNGTFNGRILCSCEILNPMVELKEDIWDRLQDATSMSPDLCSELLQTA